MPDPIVTRPDQTVIVETGITATVVDPVGMTITGGSSDPNDLGFPDIIVTQQNGYGCDGLSTVDEVVAFWIEALAAHRPPLPLRPATETVSPYINASRWVADCLCGGGMLCWDRNPRAACLDCGAAYWCAWAAPDVRSAVIRFLAARPVSHRNWDPRRVNDDGTMIETVAFIERENVLMGI